MQVTSGKTSMRSVLITAFEPYDRWDANSSWLCLLELTRNLPSSLDITTRLYPVDFAQVFDRLSVDLAEDFDFALHLGQAPGSNQVRLETTAINVGGELQQRPEEFQSLCDDGPAAYRSLLPLADWALRLREAGIPSAVSFHAGTYLCNATLYWSHYLAERRMLRTRSAFVHLPLDVSQVAGAAIDKAALPIHLSVQAVRLMLSAMERL